MKRLLLILFAIFLIASPVQGEFFKDVIVTSPTGIWTDSRAYTTLNAAVTAIGASEQDLYIAKEEVVTTLVIPANIRLHFLKDGAIANSNTLTINTKNIHSDHQIFTGAGAVNFASGTEVQSVWFEDFETAITQTSNDTVTLLINKTDTLLNSAAVGNNVLLKWDSLNLITIAAGQTLSNIGDISAPGIRLFVVSGAITFKTPSPLAAVRACWFGTSLATLGVADNAAAAAGKQLIITPGDWVVDDNITLTSNVSVLQNADLQIATTKTLTINGSLDAGPYQIFSCTGTGKVVFGAGAVKEIYPEWWATNTSPGTTDMTTAIQAAHDASVSSNSGPFAPVAFSNNQYKFSTLTWSPHVSAIAHGKVYLQTANAAGRTIQVSDEYGRPATYGLNAVRNTVFNGQFYLVNSNAANTAMAWTFGGATATNYANTITALNGVETRGFHGGVYEFRNNAFMINFINCFDYGNNGNRIIVADPVTNSGEGIRFINCQFTDGTSYVVDVNTVHAMSFDFIGCSADYNLGLNKPGNSAPLCAFNWSGGHLEWNQVALPFLYNDSASTWNVDGTYITTGTLVGPADPYISHTKNAGTTRFTNIKYALPAGLVNLHYVESATSKGVFDYSPNYQGGSAPTNYVVYHASAVIGYDGITYRESAYTPSWSGTLGNGTIVGYYTRVGKKVDVVIKLVWGSTTSHAAASQAFALPYTPSATYPGLGSWWANDYGTGDRTGTAKCAIGDPYIYMYNDATATIVTNTVPMTWAEHDEVHVHLSYFVD